MCAKPRGEWRASQFLGCSFPLPRYLRSKTFRFGHVTSVELAIIDDGTSGVADAQFISIGSTSWQRVSLALFLSVSNIPQYVARGG